MAVSGEPKYKMAKLVKISNLPKMAQVKYMPVPVDEIKKEPIDDDDDENLQCRICPKTFANEKALGNHVRIEHMGTDVNVSEWVEVSKEARKEERARIKQEKVEQEALIQLKTEEMVYSMAPADILTLANEDVSYIIIKADSGKIITKRQPAILKKKKKEVEAQEIKELKRVHARRPREYAPISGPFECLQPSNLVADGTCHQIFFSCCDYSAHYRDEHTRRRKAHKCQVCEKVLAPGPGEEPSFPYICQVCGAGYDLNKQLTEHMNTEHVKLKPFQCSVCQKRFSQQGGVQQHMRMHTGDRPYSCTYCPKSFTQKSGLDQHLRIHTKVKPYRCVVCSKTFCQSVHLKQHMRTHTHVAPFQCGICGKKFKQSSHLNYHLKNHTEANMTEEQRARYRELLGLYSSQDIVEVEVEDDNMQEESQAVETILVEQRQTEQHQQLMQQMEEQELEEQHELEEGQLEEGQLEEGEEIEEYEEIDEQQVQVVRMEEGEDDKQEEVIQDEREYILADNGDDTWTVKLVEE